MKKVFRRPINSVIPTLMVSILLSISACSSEQEQTEEPVNNTQGNQETNGSGSNEVTQGGESDNLSASSEGDTGNSNSAAETGNGTAEVEESSVPNPDTTTTPPAEGAPMAGAAMAGAAMAGAGMGAAGPAPAPPASAPPPGGVSPMPNRFVRYVQVTSAAVRSEPSDSAAAVVSLVKGDHILVTEENGWGKIADGRFIKMSDLSQKAVPRDRTPMTWN